jgi:hypothetical protein
LAHRPTLYSWGPIFRNIFNRSDDAPPCSKLTCTPSSQPQSLILEDMQPPKAKGCSLDYSIAVSTMRKFLLTPSRSCYGKPAPERSSPPETSSPASPTTHKRRLGLPVPPHTPRGENHSWNDSIDVNWESISKVRCRTCYCSYDSNLAIDFINDDEYNLGSDSDSPSCMFPGTAKGKGRPRDCFWDPSRCRLKATRRTAGRIFADPVATQGFQPCRVC